MNYFEAETLDIQDSWEWICTSQSFVIIFKSVESWEYVFFSISFLNSQWFRELFSTLKLKIGR